VDGLKNDEQGMPIVEGAEGLEWAVVWGVGEVGID
jgi:hypothetical protein